MKFEKRKLVGYLLGVLCGYLFFVVIKDFGPEMLEKTKVLDWFSVCVGLLIIIVPVLVGILINALISAWGEIRNNNSNKHFEEVVLKKIDLTDEHIERLQRSIGRDERAFLESRLHVLWGLSEIKKSLDRMEDKGIDGWKNPDPDEEEIQWVQIYCQRQIKKIGFRLRELDVERIQNEALPDE